MNESDSYEKFVENYSDLLNQLVRAGWTPGEAYSRFTTLFPEVSPDFVHKAINSGHWTFVGRKEHLLNNVMMAAALWYSVAVTHDLEPDSEYTAVHLDPVIVQDLPRLFTAAGVDAEKIASIMSRCGTTLKHLAENPYIRLDEASYDDFLEDLPSEVQGISDDVFIWPPQRSIIEDRLGEGSFSQALLRVGICPPDLEELGMSVSASAVSDRAFRNALGEFLSYCIRYDRNPTVLLYGSWAVARNQMGRVPLVGAVRAKYGSWHRALKLGRRMVNDALQMSHAKAVPARPVESYTSSETAPLRIEDLKAQGIGVVQQAPHNPHEVERQAWQSLTNVLFARLRELPWNQTLRVYYLAPESITAGDYTPYVSILRSPGGYLCEITDSNDFSMRKEEYNIEYLREQGWGEPSEGTLTWSQNFFDSSAAAEHIIRAMREGLHCERPDYFQSDDPTNSSHTHVADPTTGSVPMVPAQFIEDSATRISVQSELND